MGGASGDPLGAHPPSSPALFAALILVAALTVAPVWIAPYPPGFDVPQHAAQVAIAANRADPAWSHRDLFRANPLAPHRVGFAVPRALSRVLPIPVAFKVALSAALLALPLATRALLRGRRYDPWAPPRS